MCLALFIVGHLLSRVFMVHYHLCFAAVLMYRSFVIIYLSSLVNCHCSLRMFANKLGTLFGVLPVPAPCWGRVYSSGIIRNELIVYMSRPQARLKLKVWGRVCMDMLTLHPGPELFNLLLAGFATLLIGLGLVVLLAIRRHSSPSSMALSSPIEPSDRPATTVPVVSCAAATQEPVAEQAHGPPWTAVGPGGRPGKRTHPLYKKVATINGKVNGLSPSELKQRAEQLALSIR